MTSDRTSEGLFVTCDLISCADMNGAVFYWFFLLFFIFWTYSGAEHGKKTVLCNVMTWSIYRSGDGKFDIGKDVDFDLCTIVVYMVMGLNETTNKIQARDKWADLKVKGKGLGLVDQLVASRDKAGSSAKVIVSVGGWEDGSVKYSNMAASTVKLYAFSKSIVAFIKEHKLDGVDICWEFPTDRGGVEEDKDNFIKFLKELREQLGDKIITVHLSAKRYIIDPGYDLPLMSKYVDFLSLMSYEYNGPWEKMTGINAPLRSDNELNVEFSINHLIANGATPSKILLGIPAYGHCVNMDEVPENGVYLGVPSDTGYSNPWSIDKGLIGYHEVCTQIQRNSSWLQLFDDTSFTPYMVNERKFCSYDDPRSIKEKMKLIKSKGLGGVNVWTIDTDDFKGLCGPKYPLLRTIKSELNFKNPSIIKQTVVSHEY